MNRLFKILKIALPFLLLVTIGEIGFYVYYKARIPKTSPPELVSYLPQKTNSLSPSVSLPTSSVKKTVSQPRGTTGPLRTTSVSLFYQGKIVEVGENSITIEKDGVKTTLRTDEKTRYYDSRSLSNPSPPGGLDISPPQTIGKSELKVGKEREVNILTTKFITKEELEKSQLFAPLLSIPVSQIFLQPMPTH